MNDLPANLGLPWWIIESTLSLTATVTTKMNALPANLGLPSWLIESTLSLTATVIAIFLWSGFTRFLHKKSEKTTNPWDNIFTRSTRLPVTVLILLIGFIKILKPLVIALLDISAFRVLKLSETLTSATIFITPILDLIPHPLKH